MKNRYFYLLAVSLPVIVLDQATKIFISHTMRPEGITVIKNVFEIIHARNKGAAFGLLRDSSLGYPILVAVSLAAIGIIITLYRKLLPEQKLTAISLALILAGAAGNLIDRLRLGEVIDFLNFHWYQHYWPTFNVADSSLCIGVGLLAIDMLMEERRKKSQA